MDHRFASTLFGFAAFSTILLSSIQPAAAVDWTYSYCSSLNTADQSTSYTWPYQSNGNCTNHCKQDGGPWAFAVIQYTDCWCSNYVPGTTADSGDCLVDCPGFPDEKCGNKKKDLYIYVEMDGQPSGTKGGSQPTSAAASSSQNTPPPSSTPPPKATSAPPPPQVVTSILTQNPETIEKTVTAAPTPSSSFSTSTSKKPSTSDSPSATEQPVTVPTLVTESGNVVTRTVVITPTSTASGDGDSKSPTNVGAIAGGVAGGVVGLLAIVGGILFLLLRKRRQREQNGEGGAGITRNVSTMSRAGLLGGQAEKNPTPLTTTFGSQRSRPDDESITPITPSTRRLSQPILVDSRLNPAAVITFHGNHSRESLGSIDDSRDYGRQLNVRNPDP